MDSLLPRLRLRSSVTHHERTKTFFNIRYIYYTAKIKIKHETIQHSPPLSIIRPAGHPISRL